MSGSNTSSVSSREPGDVSDETIPGSRGQVIARAQSGESGKTAKLAIRGVGKDHAIGNPSCHTVDSRPIWSPEPSFYGFRIRAVFIYCYFPSYLLAANFFMGRSPLRI